LRFQFSRDRETVKLYSSHRWPAVLSIPDQLDIPAAGGLATGAEDADGAGDGILFRYSLLRKELQGFPGAVFTCGVRMTILERGFSLFCPEDRNA
jgi:hypothetical protein